MHRVKFTLVALVVIAAAAGALAACGGDNESTTTVQQTTTEPGTGTSTSSAVETTPGGAVVPAAPSCSQGQIYSQGQGACVNQRPGDNPCPAGEIPAADQPVCEPKD